MVPLGFSKSTDPSNVCYNSVLTDAKATFTLNNIGPSEWVKVNPGTVGFYRTRYPLHLLEQFLPSIQDKSLPPLDRLGLLDDLFALVNILYDQHIAEESSVAHSKGTVYAFIQIIK